MANNGFINNAECSLFLLHENLIRIMNIELTEVEAKRLISILKVQYEKSTEVYELSVIKKILQKLRVRIDDWIPDYTDL